MKQPSDFATRIALYELEGQAQSLLRALKPVSKPLLPSAIDRFIAGASKLPRVGSFYVQHKDEFRQAEIAQFEAMLAGTFDDEYIETSKRTVQLYKRFGIASRARISAGSVVLRAIVAAIIRKHRFSVAVAIEQSDLICRAIMFDLATTTTLYLDTEISAREARQKEIDTAIIDFNGAIGGVIEAVKEASNSLSFTTSTMQRVADEFSHAWLRQVWSPKKQEIVSFDRCCD